MAVNKVATLQIINNLGVNIDIPDTGITIPPEGDVFTDPEFLRIVVQSEDLRARLLAEDVTANDGVTNLAPQEAIVYLSLLWQRGGRSDVCGIRIVESGETTIAAATTVTLGTVTRLPNERLAIHLFVLDNVNGVNFAEGSAPLGSDSVRAYLERTSTENQFLVKASNVHATQSRTLQWAVVSVRP